MNCWGNDILNSREKPTQASAGMIQTVAAPSAPVQREDRGASQPPGHVPPGDLLVLATEILSLVVTQPILPTHLPHLKRLTGAF